MATGADGTGAVRDAFALVPGLLELKNSQLRADPGAAARVGPDFAGDPVLFGLGSVLGLALTAVEFPGGREDLVGAAGAGGGVDGAVVAAGLAHHDVGRDRVGPAQPAADFFFGFGRAGRAGFGG